MKRNNIKHGGIELPSLVPVKGGVYNVGLSRERVPKLIKMRKVENWEDFKEDYFLNACPRFSVKLHDYSISARLVTIKEFEAFVRSTNYKTEAEKEGWGWVLTDRWKKEKGASWKNPFGKNYERAGIVEDYFPVVQVSWNDSIEYCEWLAKHTGKSVGLPAESEWEVFASLHNAPSLNDAGNLFEEEGGTKDFPAEYFRENKSYHRTGLLWEWTNDWFKSYPGGKENSEFGHTYKVLRGGSYRSNAIQKCAEYRFRRCPTARSCFYGFRIVL